MPLYDFQCNDCNIIFEISCKIKDLKNSFHLCPNCKSSSTAQKIFSAPLRAESHRLSGVNSRQKEFKDVLNRIHKTTPGSVLDKTTNL